MGISCQEVEINHENGIKFQQIFRQCYFLFHYSCVRVCVFRLTVVYAASLYTHPLTKLEGEGAGYIRVGGCPS